jgi:hypothetical protein
MKGLRALQVIGLLIALTVGTAVSAAPVVSTYPATVNSGYGPGWNDYAVGFVWNTSASFASADIYVEAVGSPGALSVGLFSDSGGAPGTLLTALTGPANPGVAASYTYSGITSLVQGNTYWIVASTGAYLDANEYYWYIGTMGDPNYVNTTWRRPPDYPAWSPSGLITPAAFQVNAVPLPASLLLLAPGLLGLVGMRRRFKI